MTLAKKSLAELLLLEFSLKLALLLRGLGSSVSGDFSMGGGRQAVPAESWQQLVPPDIIAISLANCKGEACFCGL